MTLNEFYTTVGGNYEDVIARLHSEAFTEKFLQMIPQDNSLPLLKEAAAAGDVPTAFRAVHTLKGIALNLGLTGLAAACGAMTEALRSRDTLPEQTDVLLRAVDREYQKVCDTLARLNPHTEPRKTT